MPKLMHMDQSYTGGTLSSLSQMTDVNISNPSDGQMLRYNGTSGKWENYTSPTFATAGVSCLTGDTTCTIQNAGIHTTSLIEPMIDNASGDTVGRSNVAVTEGQAVITFDKALTEDATVWCRVTNYSSPQYSV